MAEWDCPHVAAVPVAFELTGEVVAYLCPTCDLRLPAWWGCLECESEPVYAADRFYPVSLARTNPCPAHLGML